MIVAFSRAALRDLEAISDFISADGPPAAYRIVEDLEAACLSLVEFPQRYPILGEIDGEEVRRRSSQDYLVLYIVRGTAIEIARVVHGHRDLTALLD